MQQVLVINGGSTFLRHEDFVSYLKNKKISLDRIRSTRDWKDSLGEDLGSDYDVFVPRMPNSQNAEFEAWKKWFERMMELMDDNIILIGHSLGGIFLAKYLAKNDPPKEVKATMLVAAPYDDESVESLTDFKIDLSLEKFAKVAGKIYLIQSEDDPVVRFTELAKYQSALPHAQSITFTDKLHFFDQHFPELVDLIKSISPK